MNFLQPWMLVSLPLVALPIVIHLINQRRYQSVRWAAMMFLLAASRMSRGYARLRQWLILAFRMLAIATLVFVASRPLAGGWLGTAAGGRPDTTIVLVDRSPSMQQGGAGATGSKLETVRERLAQTLETIGSGRWVLIESSSATPRLLESPRALLSANLGGPVTAAADLPAMLESARDYIRENASGSTEVWIASDLRANDWNPDGGRWPALRDAFRGFPQRVRFHLLAYPQPAPENLSVRVLDVRRRSTRDGAELLVSLRLTREGGGDSKGTVPIHFEIDGARSERVVAMSGPRYELRDHRLPLEAGRRRGWGRISIPADANPADNDAWFAFDESEPMRTLVVADDREAGKALALAASIAPDPSVACSATLVVAEAVATAPWDATSLLLWQGPLPVGDAAKRILAFLDRGGRMIAFPPRAEEPGGTFLGASWGGWTAGSKPTPVENWRSDDDLLAHTLGGLPLPVGQLEVRRFRELRGELTPLATLVGGAPLLAKAMVGRGGAAFCATTPAAADSSLARGGVVLYVLVQRALALGAKQRGRTRQLVAGADAEGDPTRWTRLAGPEDAPANEYPLHGGVYRSGERLIAVNRPEAEDAAPVLADRRVAALFQGLSFSRADDRAGAFGSLIQEVWRPFLVLMIAAMMIEAGLCLPPRPGRVRGPSA